MPKINLKFKDEKQVVIVADFIHEKDLTVTINYYDRNAKNQKELRSQPIVRYVFLNAFKEMMMNDSLQLSIEIPGWLADSLNGRNLYIELESNGSVMRLANDNFRFDKTKDNDFEFQQTKRSAKRGDKPAPQFGHANSIKEFSKHQTLMPDELEKKRSESFPTVSGTMFDARHKSKRDSEKSDTSEPKKSCSIS